MTKGEVKFEIGSFFSWSGEFEGSHFHHKWDDVKTEITAIKSTVNHKTHKEDILLSLKSYDNFETHDIYLSEFTDGNVHFAKPYVEEEIKERQKRKFKKKVFLELEGYLNETDSFRLLTRQERIEIINEILTSLLK